MIMGFTDLLGNRVPTTAGIIAIYTEQRSYIYKNRSGFLQRFHLDANVIKVAHRFTSLNTRLR